MLEEFHHTSVLKREVLQYLVTNLQGFYLDCTLGAGGHAAAILDTLTPEGTLLAFDVDPQALQAAELRLQPYTGRYTLINSNFRFCHQLLQEKYGTPRPLLDGVLFDLGVSSPQLDNPERGFTYWEDAPLDMRLSSSQTTTAADILNSYSYRELQRIIAHYGEERWASRIASAIVQERARAPLTTARQLVTCVYQGIPAAARRQGGHPARRTFMALRMAVNNELPYLAETLPQIIPWLKIGGRLAVISFNSLEDRLVKEFIAGQENPCTCPKQYPCVCGLTPSLKRVNRKPITPSIQESESNPRARSAKLRIAERV
ncbi:MAG: 16S rRNA (cytosine(1402)-N(4))-methyltransferase RsmH [Symbiobacteriaceae bacterium]|nr:16S rRNA (cytosine(1402)-N(4))-methyltransferase RsmH [Symbiobacteriaceae bacterium]